jgi:hypothetical protein
LEFKWDIFIYIGRREYPSSAQQVPRKFVRNRSKRTPS